MALAARVIVRLAFSPAPHWQSRKRQKGLWRPAWARDVIRALVRGLPHRFLLLERLFSQRASSFLLRVTILSLRTVTLLCFWQFVFLGVLRL